MSNLYLVIYSGRDETRAVYINSYIVIYIYTNKNEKS
jgi:hypothetical protein